MVIQFTGQNKKTNEDMNDLKYVAVLIVDNLKGKEEDKEVCMNLNSIIENKNFRNFAKLL